MIWTLVDKTPQENPQTALIDVLHFLISLLIWYMLLFHPKERRKVIIYQEYNQGFIYLNLHANHLNKEQNTSNDIILYFTNLWLIYNHKPLKWDRIFKKDLIRHLYNLLHFNFYNEEKNVNGTKTGKQIKTHAMDIKT